MSTYMTAALGSMKAQSWYTRRESSTKLVSSWCGGVEAAWLRKACKGWRYLRGKVSFDLHEESGFIWKGKAGWRCRFEGQGRRLLRCGTYAFSREDMRLLDAAQAVASAMSLKAAANVELSGKSHRSVRRVRATAQYAMQQPGSEITRRWKPSRAVLY